MSNINDFVIEYISSFISGEFLGNKLVKYNGTYKNVNIPDSVTEIGKNAFSGCASLMSINIPDSVTKIGRSAFFDCTSLTSINIPDSVTEIGSSAFSGCAGLTRVTIPDSVTSIGDRAFYQCYGLTSINIPNSVTEIGWKAFSGCTSLTGINIPDSVTEIGASAFSRCNSLKKILVIGCSDWDTCGLQELSDLESLSVLVAPKISFEVLKKQGLAVAASMGFLTNIEMFSNHPEEEDYQKYIFSQKKRILPEIFKEDLVECLNFYSQNGRITKKNFDEEFFTPAQSANATKCVAFLMDWKSKNISQEDADKQLEKELTKDPFNVADMKKLWSFEKLKDETLAITGYKGEDTVVFIPERIGKNTVTAIADNAFSSECASRKKADRIRMQGIKEIVMPDSIKKIGDFAFYGCTSLTSIHIPDSVKSIGDYTFSHCTSLANITIPNSMKSIGDCTFSHCTSLPNIEIPASVAKICWSAFNNCSSLTSIVIPDSVKSIGNNAFSHCTSLTSITIPDSVKSIGDYTFSHCTSLTTIYISENNRYYKSIDGNLYTKDGRTLIQYTMGKKAALFEIPDSVMEIRSSAFYGCTSLTNVVIPDSVTKIGYEAFSGCTSLASITIPDSVTEIGSYAFCGCTSLTSITIPNYATKIGDDVFRGCTSLTSIHIPDSVMEIGSSAFSGCTSLTSINIPDSVTKIGSFAFDFCRSLTVYYGGSEEDWNNISIDKYNDFLNKATVHFGKE